MKRLLKWSLYIVLLGAYLWAVFVWDRFPKPAPPPDFSQAEAISQMEEVSEDTTAVPEDTSLLTDTPQTKGVADGYGSLDLPSEAYLVIGGSFEALERAEQEQRRLSSLYVSSQIVFIAPYYRLVLGAYESPSLARSTMLDMRALGIDAYVHQQP